jgi:RNA polymerase sigma-70 factor, ECF subfamily
MEGLATSAAHADAGDTATTPARWPDAAAARALEPLIVAMRGGDERALETLYDATVGKLYALATAILHESEDAEEVVCSTYAYAWSNVARFDAARANPLGWLLMLCRSRALDRLRQRRALATTVDIVDIAEHHADDGAQPDELLSLMQEHSRVHAALSKLAPDRRRLISLAFLQGMTHPEIAAVTGLPLGTVKSHVRRALSQLRVELEAV